MQSFEEFLKFVEQREALNSNYAAEKKRLEEAKEKARKIDGPSIEYWDTEEGKAKIEGEALVLFKNTSAIEFALSSHSLLGNDTTMPDSYNRYEREITMRTLEMHRLYLAHVKDTPYAEKSVIDEMKQINSLRK